MTCKAWTLAAGLALGAAGHACADIKLGYLDTLSGPTGGVGEATLTTFQLAVDRINAAGGVAGEPFALEVYDGKGKPDEVLVQFQKAIDDGVRHFLLANG
ncbi:MAG: ABC transporter substrate-binding protein, partial [Pseudomonadota bacterium]|nr:ABC transporter substrate-binding protein [Pseudomonadota bacterium]